MSSVASSKKSAAKPARRLDVPRLSAGELQLSPSAPMQIPLDLIDEDPTQPRTVDNPGFSAESLEELAVTIRLRGVKTPISVRNHPRAKGRYMINHGARRFRASKLAGKNTIPGFIDNDYDNADQVIENLHRNALTPREIADYIGRELARGKLKRDIAKELGKSPAFISQHVTLLDLPDPVADLFNTGRCRDVTLINELVTVFKINPEEVARWLTDDTQEITRGSVKLLREFLEYKEGPEELNPEDLETIEAEAKDQVEQNDVATDPDKLRHAIVQVRYKDKTARLILHRRPMGKGYAWLKYEDDGEEVQAKLASVQLLAIFEGYKPHARKDRRES